MEVTGGKEMSNYIELYKKYRPRNWDDIVGQQEVVRSLRKAVIDNEIPTSYLFAGKQHGAGKTSMALIMAKALNCENLDMETGNPCNECRTCKAIDENRQPGVNYVSMANRGSAAEVRKIVDSARLAQPVKKQIWILDESHNMSKEAAESLLIPLEDESMKSLFIFCSTEPEKILPTVKSRLQLRSFTTISTKDVAIHLSKIAKKEGYELTKEQILEAAVEGAGSLRDALTNLEQVARGKEITTSYKNKVLNAIVQANVVNVLSLSNEMDADGIDYKRTLEQLYRDYANMMLLVSGAELPELANAKTFANVGGKIGIVRLSQSLDIIGQGLQSMSINTSINNRIMFEITMTKIVNLLRGGK